MSLRYRLFLWVGGLYVAIAASSFFLQNYVTRKELARAQESVRTKIIGLSEKKRIDLQNFLAVTLAENQVSLNAVLTNLLSFSPEVLGFGPTEGNIQYGTWGNSSSLALDYKKIDFLQNSGEGQVMAGILPGKGMQPSYRIDINNELSWIFLDHSTPYLALRTPYTIIYHSSDGEQEESPENVSGEVPQGFLLFDFDEMKKGGSLVNDKDFPPIPVGWSELYMLQVEPLVQAFQRAVGLAKSDKLKPPALPSAAVKAPSGELGGHLTTLPQEKLIASPTATEAMRQRLQAISERYNEIGMIWLLGTLHNTGIFGPDLFSFPSPKGIAFFSGEHSDGVGFKSQDVFFTDCLFDDAGYFQSSSPSTEPIRLGGSLAVIAPPGSHNVYVGNTGELSLSGKEGERTGYLTLGIDVEPLLQSLVFAIHQTALLVHDGQPVFVYDEDQQKIDLGEFSSFDFTKMLSTNTGLVPWQGEQYFYMHLQPYSDVDLHFILLNPEEKEFALLRDLEEGSKHIIDSMLFNIHVAGFVALLIAIILLHNISRSITKPIVQLAKATGDVVEGRYDQVELELPPLKHNDEIAVLCHSFEGMVIGLKEKEKVKGVLNKVVSREVAQEILKGNVHLGGEEKKVTVLFADIREFTKMTQSMQPQGVVEMLNSCMTRISQIIEKHGGVIDKYVGDEAMSLFGAPIPSEDAACMAVQSAIEIVDALQKWNAQRAISGLPPIDVGIGIHTGPMLVGNMGAENRLNYTVIGSNVNLASRLCGAAKRMEILITKDTLDECKDKIVCEPVGPMEFKGFDARIEVFRVKGMR